MSRLRRDGNTGEMQSDLPERHLSGAGGLQLLGILIPGKRLKIYSPKLVSFSC
jgi:hypothetical protein